MTDVIERLRFIQIDLVSSLASEGRVNGCITGSEGGLRTNENYGNIPSEEERKLAEEHGNRNKRLGSRL